MAKVYLVGAGPGAPDLITLRAARVIEKADVIFYDALVHPDTVALAINAKKVAVGKRAGQVSTDQRFINRQLVEATRQYQNVVRLKGGDPMIFGRAQEEIDALHAAGVSCEVVPGITAALAASADLKTSLTRRGVSRNVTFVTPRVGEGEDASDWKKSVCSADTTVMYMAAGQAAVVAAELIANGMAYDMPVVIVENASLPAMAATATTLGALQSAGERMTHGGPALLMIGRVFKHVKSARSAVTDRDALREVLSA